MKKLLKIGRASMVILLLLATILPSLLTNIKIFANETLRVDLNIINLYGNNTIDQKREFWVTESVPAAVDVAVSGRGAALNEPWVVLTVPKLKTATTTKITKPSFVDSSDAYETVRTEDDNNYYVTYKFKRIAGGFRGTYPFPFVFNEAPTNDRDELPINVKIVDGASTAETKPVLYNTDVVYIARKQQFMTNIAVAEWYHHGHPKVVDDTFDNSTTKLVSDTYVWNVNAVEGQTTTGDTPITLKTKMGINLKVPADTTGIITLKPAEYVKQVYTLPETIEPKITNGRVTENGLVTWGDGSSTYNPTTRQLTLVYTPKVTKQHWHYYTNPHLGEYDAQFEANNAPFNEVLNVRVQITQKYENEPEKTYQEMALPIKFVPTHFKPTGSIRVWKDNLNSWVDIDGRNIWYDEGKYTYTKPEGNLYSAQVNLNELRMIQQGIIRNENNGSSFSDATNGIVSDVYKITDILNRDRNGLFYKTFKFFQTPETKSVDQQINEKQNIVYGVKADGTRVELARNVKTTDTVSINDTTMQYVNLEIEFPEPIRVNKGDLRYIIEVDLTKEEWEKHRDGTYNNRQSYYGKTEVDAIFAQDPAIDASKAKHYGETYDGNYSGVSLWKVEPKIEIAEVTTDKPTLVFNAKGTELTHRFTIRPVTSSFGPIEQVKNLKAVVLLPVGFEYKNTASYSTNMYGYTINKEAPEVVENYKGTGQTAVIYPINDFNVQKSGDRLNINTTIEATKYANKGDNRIVTYVTYDDNDIITPYTNNQAYKDELDLDGDNNREETYLYSWTTVNYIPPLELLISKQVGLEPTQMGLVTTGDLGYNFYYGIRLFNNTISEVRTATVIDVLPYVGDTVLAPNQAGEYTPRQSEFVTPLSMALEDVPENQNVLSRFNFYYQLEPQGATVESVRDGRWVTKDDVSDFSKVKSVKFELKPGAFLLSKEEVMVYISSKLPILKTLPENSYAHNTAGASTDSVIYTEGNKASVTFAKYTVDGTYFKDLNKNGVLDDTEDKVAGRTVELIDVATNQVAVDSEGKAIRTTTDSNGQYHFDVYKRGEYKVRFTAKNTTEEFTAKFGKLPENNHVTSAEDTQEDDVTRRYGLTESFVLNPTRKTAVVNAGIISTSRDVRVLKVSQDVDSENNKTVLSGATFELRRLDGTVVQTLTTNANGTATFVDVPFGSYILVETVAPNGYAKTDIERTIVVGESALSVQEVENSVIKGSVVVTKVDADDQTKMLSGVTFALKQGDKEVATAITDENGKATFNNVVYGDYTLIEKATLPNYNLSSETKQVQVREHGVTVDLGTVTNALKKGTVVVTKVDTDDQSKVLSGVTFALKQGDKEVATAVTDENGKATFNNVVYGDYILVEKATLPNYILSSETKQVEVRENGVTVDLGTVTNALKKGTVVVTKVDADDQTKVLSGVTFALKQGDKEIATAVTDENGQATFNNVVYGDYTLVEKSTLPNYNLSSETKQVVVREHGVTIDLGTITNTLKKGTVVVTKVDADDQTKVLSGVTFVLKQGDEEVATAVTDENGKATFNNVVYGDYIVVEKATLPNYNLSSEEKAVEVREHGVTVDLGTITNALKKGTVVVTKVDADDQTKVLSGVTFALKQGDEEIATAITDENGQATFNNVVYGDYTLVEKATLPNYNLSSETKQVVVREHGVTVDLGTITNTLKKGTVVVTKVDADNQTKVLSGVTFALNQGDKEIATAVTDAKGQAIFNNVVYGDYTVIEKATLPNYILSSETKQVAVREHGATVDLGTVTNALKKGTVVVTKVDADDQTKVLSGVTFALKQGDKEIATAVTDENGQATFDDVVYGDYTLVEKATLPNYNLSSETKQVQVREHGVTVDLGTVTNALKKGTVVVTKVDADDQTKVLSGVTFALKQGDKEIDTAVTDAKGQVTFNNVVYGDYTLVEKATLPNYNLSSETKQVAVREHGVTVDLGKVTNALKKGTVVVTKVDADDQTKVLSGVTFALKQGDKEIATAVTDENGQATFNNVVYGDYTVIEKATLPNYNLSSETKQVAVREHGVTVDLGTVTNALKKGTVVVTKVDADDQTKVLSGVTFALKQDDNEVATAITDDNGQATFNNVVYGDYTLVEKSTLPNYNLSSETKQVQVRENGATVTVGTITNALKKGTVVVTKVDADDQTKVLSGVTFALKQGDKEVATAVTDENGKATFNNVVYGDYTLVEKATLPNYILSSETKQVEVRENGVTVDLGKVTNALKKGTVVVTKVDADDQTKVLSGVTFVLKQGDKEVYTTVTDENGKATFNDVVYGDYTLIEKATLPNYNLSSETKQVQVREHGVTVDLGTVTNALKKGTVVLTKVDADDQTKVLSGVTFALKQGDKEIATAITDDNGQIVFEDVVYGDYTVVEKETLVNYNLNTEDIKVEVREHGVTVDLGKVTNALKKGTVVVTKVDADDQTKVLSGVTFVLKQGDEEVATAVTDENGKATFNNVVYGDYIVVEKATLPNYNLSSEEKAVEVREHGVTVDLGTITNALKKGTVVVTKVDADDQTKVLSGVTFALKQGDEEIATAITDENGQATFNNVVYGDYTLVEKETVSGYILSDEVRQVTISEHNQLVDLGHFANKKAPVVKPKNTALPKTGTQYDHSIWATLCLVIAVFMFGKWRFEER